MSRLSGVSLLTVAETLLVVGGSHSEIPLILAARDLGYRVATTGNRPQDVGHAYGDVYLYCDYSNPDDVLAVARESDATGVVSGANDFAALSAAYVAANLGLPGHDQLPTAKLLHHKDLFRSMSQAHGFPVPAARAVSDPAEALDVLDELKLPVLVKPVDLTGGKGISRVSCREEVGRAVLHALRLSRESRVVVEEFITGSRHGASALIIDGTVRFLFVDDEHYLENPFLVAAASAPTSVSSDVVECVREIIGGYVRTLGLVDGIFHVQFINASDGPVVVEVCRRPPGDLYPWLVGDATGVPYTSWVVQCAVGEHPAVFQPDDPPRPTIRACLMAERPGTILGLELDDFSPGKIVRDCIWRQEGDKIVDPHTEKLGIVIAQYSSKDELARVIGRFRKIARPVMAAVHG